MTSVNTPKKRQRDTDVKSESVMILLGAGGANPRLEKFDIGLQETRSLAEFSPGESIYAIDWSPNAKRIAVGTRSGSLYTLKVRSEMGVTEKI